MNERWLETRRGARVRVLEGGPADGPPLVFWHGLTGLLNDTNDTFLDLLAARHRVFAPELPGYGDSRGEELLEDMLDFSLHGWDVLDGLGLSYAGRRPALVGHSLGGMIAAEMTCLAPGAIDKLVLVDPFGLWLDEHPIPDFFSFLPFEFGDYLFHDTQRATELLVGATELADPDSLREFFIGNARRLGTAGKILFPIPNRRLSVKGDVSAVGRPHAAVRAAARASARGARLPGVTPAGHLSVRRRISELRANAAYRPRNRCLT